MTQTQINDVVMRVVLTRRVEGPVTLEKRHKIVKALRHLLALVGPTHSTYTVDVCEVADVRRVR